LLRKKVAEKEIDGLAGVFAAEEFDGGGPSAVGPAGGGEFFRGQQSGGPIASGSLNQSMARFG
jgi:hypothetical protein